MKELNKVIYVYKRLWQLKFVMVASMVASAFFVSGCDNSISNNEMNNQKTDSREVALKKYLPDFEFVKIDSVDAQKRI